MINLKQLRIDVKNKRLIHNDMSMDVAAKEIGISKATLSRIEREKKERAERNAQKALGAQEKQADEEKKSTIAAAMERVKQTQQQENVKN